MTLAMQFVFGTSYNNVHDSSSWHINAPETWGWFSFFQVISYCFERSHQSVLSAFKADKCWQWTCYVLPMYCRSVHYLILVKLLSVSIMFLLCLCIQYHVGNGCFVCGRSCNGWKCLLFILPVTVNGSYLWIHWDFLSVFALLQVNRLPLKNYMNTRRT